MNECSKATARRLRDPHFQHLYFVGNGIDVGAGADSLWRQREHFPRMASVYAWDLLDGDAATLPGVESNACDFLHSSHCLEDLRDPWPALCRWVDVVRPSGYLVITVPDEDMYEQGVWPSTWNSGHRRSFTLGKHQNRHLSVHTVDVLDLVQCVQVQAMIVKLERITEHFDPTGPRRDQTLGPAECAIEFILRKRP